MSEQKKNISILVIMQDCYERTRMVKLLKKAVSKVYEAQNGSEALTLFRTRQPDAVLTDLTLTGMNGADLISAIRAEDADTHFIAAFDIYNPKVLLRAAEMGMDAFIRLPVEPPKLLAAVAKCTRSILMKRKLAQQDSVLWGLLDVFPGMALLEQNGRVIHANQQLCSFCGYESFRHMKAANKNIHDHVLQVNGSPFGGSDADWINSLVNDQLDRDHTIHMATPGNPSGRPGVFAVFFKPFPNDRFRLFTFQDISDLDEERSLLQDEASTDPLTGAMNRRSFMRILDQELALNREVSLIMFDIDHFKSINDTYGHDIGDAVLKEISQLVRENIRENDSLIRWGGEEFMVLAPNSNIARAMRMAERMRSKVEGFRFSGVPRAVTSSFGVACRADFETGERFLKRVDQALYQAKDSGRNRVVQG